MSLIILRGSSIFFALEHQLLVILTPLFVKRGYIIPLHLSTTDFNIFLPLKLILKGLEEIKPAGILVTSKKVFAPVLTQCRSILTTVAAVNPRHLRVKVAN